LAAKSATAAVLVLLVFVLVRPSTAQANGLNTSVNSAGYIYLQNVANDGIDRYNIATGQVEAINMSSASCQALDRNSIYEMAFDNAGSRIYWSNFSGGSSPNYRTQINVLNLKTGTCENLAQEAYVYVSNGDYYSFAGIALDIPNGRLYYVDEGGAHTTDPGPWQNKNRTLRWVDLNDSSANRDHIIELTNEQYSYTVGFAKDVVLDGDFVYLGGKNFDSPNNKNSGDGIYKARVTTGNVVEAVSEISTVVSFEENNTDIYELDKRGDNIFYLSWNATATGGIYRFNTSDPWATLTQVMMNSWPANDPTGNWKYTGFTLGQGDEMFTIDSPPGWGPLVFYSSHEGNTPNMMVGTYHPSTYWGLFNYNSGLVPAAPIVNSVPRTTDTTASINFTPSIGADVDGNYIWTAKPVGGGDDLSGSCTASPCTVSGLSAGVHYNFSMAHNFRNSAGEAIVRSNFSGEVIDTVSAQVSISRTFDGFPTMSSVLSKAQKSTIRAWINANPSLTQISCIGKVGYNWANVSKAELKYLAKSRAKAVCNYIHKIKPAIRITSTTYAVTKSKSAAIRLVSVTAR
jgi:hypothetical protein